MMKELKPCPFCGGEAEINKKPLWNGNHGYKGCYEFVVVCKKCGCKADHIKNDSIYRSEEEAQENVIKVWNRRVSQEQDVPDTNVGDVVSKLDAQERQHVAQKRKYTFANDEFSLESAYRDCKLVFDEITDDDSFQKADAGLVFYYANEIIYALREALQSKDTNAEDTISRQAAISAVGYCQTYLFDSRDKDKKISLEDAEYAIAQLPSAQPEQRWIPVAERPPEDITAAIVTAKTKTFKQKYVCEAVWIPRWSKKTEYDCCEDCSEYNEDEDEYYVSEGWYERVRNWDEYSYIDIEDDVIAWKPMPEPYKEKEE